MSITDLANETYLDLESPSDISIPSIARWYQENVGRLNNLLDLEIEAVRTETDYTIDISIDEKDIFKLVYQIDYFNRQRKRNLGAAAINNISEVREGNRTVKRANKNEVAKSYKELVADLNDSLMNLILAYKMNRADPSQSIVPNPITNEDFSGDGFGTRGYIRGDFY